MTVHSIWLDLSPNFNSDLTLHLIQIHISRRNHNHATSNDTNQATDYKQIHSADIFFFLPTYFSFIIKK